MKHLRYPLNHLASEVEAYYDEGESDLRLNNINLRFEELSDGYRSLMALTGHLVRCALAARIEGDPTELHGIALIDEMDIHLHPTWQTHVISDFQNAFPNLQLIVSTHAPLIIGALKKEEVLVLRREKSGAIVLKHPEYDPQGLGAAGILTSAFDLSTTIDQPTLDKINRHLFLFSQMQMQATPLSEKEQKEYKDLTDELARLGFNHEYSDPYFKQFCIVMYKYHKAALGKLTPEEKRELDEYAYNLIADIMKEDMKEEKK